MDTKTMSDTKECQMGSYTGTWPFMMPPKFVHNPDSNAWKQNLKPMGKLLDKLHLVTYSELFGDIDITWEYYWRPIACFFKGHIWTRMFRSPRPGEHGDPSMCNMIRVTPEKCLRCWKNRWGLKSDLDD